MTSEHNRRRFLELTGTGTAAALAGCADINPLGDEDEGEYDDMLTAVVSPDREEFEELQESIENDEMDVMEAQQRQEEMIEESIEEFESLAEDDSDLEIEDSAEEFGLYRIDGSPESAIDALQAGPIASLYGGAEYDPMLADAEQRRAQQEQQPPEAAPEDEGIEDGEETDDEGDEADDGEAADEEADDDSENGAGADDGETDADGDENEA